MTSLAVGVPVIQQRRLHPIILKNEKLCVRLGVVARASQWRGRALSGASYSWGPPPHCCRSLSHASSWGTSFPTAGEGTVRGCLSSLLQFLVSRGCPWLEGRRAVSYKRFVRWGPLETW